MGIPQLILLGLFIWFVLCWVYDFGKGKTERKYFIGNMVFLAIIFSLLWWGGFWT